MTSSPEAPRDMPEDIPQGVRWLKLIGREDRIGKPTRIIVDGVPVLAEDFDTLCGEHAQPIFAGLESLDQNDPRYNLFRDAARKAFDDHFSAPEAGS